MAHKLSGGRTKNGRDSKPKYLGVRHYNNQYVTAGSILVLQRGLQFKAGKNVFIAKNFSLYAAKDGFVFFNKDRFVDIIPN